MPSAGGCGAWNDSGLVSTSLMDAALDPCNVTVRECHVLLAGADLPAFHMTTDMDATVEPDHLLGWVA